MYVQDCVIEHSPCLIEEVSLTLRATYGPLPYVQAISVYRIHHLEMARVQLLL